MLHAPHRAARRRRRALALAAVVALLAIVFAAGCGGGDSSSSDTGTTTAGGSSDLNGTTLSYLGFGGGIDDQIKARLMDPFSRQTGAQFILDQPTDYKKIQAQVDSGNVTYDVIDGDPYVIDAECGRQYEPLNVDLSAVQPEFRPNSRCSVPDFVYGYVIAFDRSKFPNGGPQNCRDFFDTKAYPGKRAMWSYYVSGILECAAIADGADPKNPYPLDLDKAFAKLDELKGDVVFYDTTAQAVDGMENQDVAMGLYATRAMVDADAKGAPFTASTEWAARAAGAFGVPKGAPHKAAAEQWLSFIMEKPNYNTGLVPVYGSPLGGELPPEANTVERQLNVVTGDIKDNAMDIDWTWWQENVGTASERFTNFATG